MMRSGGRVWARSERIVATIWLSSLCAGITATIVAGEGRVELDIEVVSDGLGGDR